MKPKEVQPKHIKNYSVSPYNFVSLPKVAVTKYKKPQELPPHNDFRGRDKNSLLSGYIEYIVEAKTPIIVSKGLEDRKAKFFINVDGEYAIPGSTMRGMVRTNAQILSFSNIIGEKDEKNKYVNSYIEDSRFLYRDVASGTSLNNNYKKVLAIDLNKRIARDMKTGYIINKEDKFYIQPSVELKEGIPYFRVDELKLRKIGGEKIEDIDFLYAKELLEHEDELNKLNKMIATNKGNKGVQKSVRDELKSILKKYSREGVYKPYQAEISFDLDKKGRITKIGKIGECSHEGYILSGGFISGKRSHYVVPAGDTQQAKEKVPEENIRAYKDDMLATQKAIIKDGKFVVKDEFYALPKENEQKPVFYIKTNRLHFGFTPFLRLSYSKTVLDGVPSGYKDVEGISYADAIFGFTNKSYEEDGKINSFSYKSRVSFEDAVIIGEGIEDKESIIDIILAEPKPTSYNLYLEQSKNADKKILNIYEGDFTIRGFKQYWLKDYVEKPVLEVDKAENMKTTIYPLKEGTKFRGKIYFDNLDEEELGLLAWALKLNDDCYQNIGLAKPYGFGRVEVKDVKLNIEDLNKKYSSFSFDYYEEANADKYIDIYKKNFSNKNLNDRDIEKEKPIEELMYIKSKVIKSQDANDYRYMKLDEFRKRKVLPEICECQKEYLNEIKEYNPNKSNYQSKNYSFTGNRDIRKTNKNYRNEQMYDAWNKAQKEKQKRDKKNR